MSKASEYILYKRYNGKTAPVYTPCESFATFQLAWEHAMELFESQRFTVVGCHLEPEFPHNPAYAEFWCIRAGVHYCYTISKHIPE